MPYIKRTTRAGKTIEVEMYYTAKYNRRGYTRADRMHPSTEQQKRINTRHAEAKLRILMNANFGYGDYHLVLDYIRKPGEPDRTKEKMKKDIAVFLRECRKEYRKAGKEFKYIHVMEIGKKGARHHHLVVNKIDPEILQKAWYKAYEGHNRVKVFPLDDSGNYAKLAAYFIKYSSEHLKDEPEERLQGKRWAASKNLVRPEPHIEIISNRAWFRTEAKPIKGYYIDKDSIQYGMTDPDYGGFGWMRYIMVELEDQKGVVKGRERKKRNKGAGTNRKSGRSNPKVSV